MALYVVPPLLIGATDEEDKHVQATNPNLEHRIYACAGTKGYPYQEGLFS
jgi:hypothetical protein